MASQPPAYAAKYIIAGSVSWRAPALICHHRRVIGVCGAAARAVLMNDRNENANADARQ